MRTRREEGQGSLEYAGMVAVAGLLVASMVFAVVGTDNPISSAVSRGICVVTSPLTGAACEEVTASAPGQRESDVPTYQDPSLTPEEQAESGGYVALGDSFSSGEGGSEYEEGTDVDEESLEEDYFTQDERPMSPRYPGPRIDDDPYSNTCRRSTGAYGQQIAADFDFSGGFAFHACSGAIIDDFTQPNGGYDEDEPWKGNDDEEPQLDTVDEDTSLVTFSIGGNDANFGKALEACVAAGLNPFDSCSDDDEQEQVHDDITAVGPELTELLRQLREEAPNARILIVGYPRFFPDEPLGGFSDGTQIDEGDQEFVNEETAYMNDVIAAAIEDAGGSEEGFEFVDVYDAFEGCEIGQDPSCMNNLQNGFGQGKPVDNGSYHPNDLGHEQLADYIEEQIRDPQE